MQTNTLKPLVIFLIYLALQSVNAQSLYIKGKNGTKTSVSLSSIQKLTFGVDKMVINKKTGAEDIFNLSSIQYMNFTESENISGVLSVKKDNPLLTLYPNPVIDILNVHCLRNKPDIATIEILSIDGKVLIRNKQTICESNADIKIDVSYLQKGAYVCRCNFDNVSLTAKFFKR